MKYSNNVHRSEELIAHLMVFGTGVYILQSDWPQAPVCVTIYRAAFIPLSGCGCLGFSVNEASVFDPEDRSKSSQCLVCNR